MNAISKENIEDILPLSSTQEGMLFHYISNPDSLNYHEQVRFVLTGDIKVDVLQKAWDFVIESNEALRSVFRWEKLEKPLQIVLKSFKSTIHFYDFTQSKDFNSSVERVANDDFGKKIDISSETVRLYLCKNDEYYEMIISNHHILYDGWSNGIIIKELVTAYLCFYKGEVPTRRKKSKLKEYNTLASKQDDDMQKEYWQKFFNEYDTMLSKKENNGIQKDFSYQISEELIQDVKRYAKERKVSYASVLFSIWGILLHKYRGTNDIIFGTTVSGRDSRIIGVDEMVGMFINTIPLRVIADDKDTLFDIITKVNSELIEREEYEHTDLLKIKEYGQIGAKDEIFDSIVVIENYPIENELLHNDLLKIKSFSAAARTNYELALGIMLFKGLELNFHYFTHVYSDKIIENMARQYEMLINTVLKDDSLSYSKMDITSEQDKNLLLHQFNDNTMDYPKNKTITDIFSEQVTRKPDHTAVVYKGETLTYAELDEKSNQLAAAMLEKGVRKQAVVALLLDRSLEMIVGIMAVLKAGGVYLPIDIANPNDRIKYILDDSNAEVVLTHRNYMEDIIFQGLMINMDEEKVIYSSQSVGSLNRPSDFAYIIYTSGSTGKPKGTLMTHRNVVNLVYGFLDTTFSQYNGSLNFALVVSYAFDASVLDIFNALLFGNSLHVISTDDRLNGQALISYINKHSIDTFVATPMHIGIINEAESKDKCIAVKHFLVGGDVLLPNVVKELYHKFPENNFSITNIYGPTECSVISTIYKIRRDDIEELNRIPIGKPMPNTSIYILDRYENLVPMGGVGEICIAGDGVGGGYLNSPKLTEEKFHQDPYDTNQKLYKSGDLGRWLPDGTIDFLGRIDNQVKLRGYRIELEEIEKEILCYNTISNCKIQSVAVIDRVDKSGSKYLCVYYTSDSDINILDLKKYLSQKLPVYMIPSYYMKIDKIPLNQNLKLDKKKLPEINFHEIKDEYEEPRNEIEVKLVEIWCKVLEIEKIGCNDNFFEVGGHSIKAMTLINKIQKELNKKVSLEEIFISPTIKELAKIIESKEIEYSSQIPKIERKSL